MQDFNQYSQQDLMAAIERANNDAAMAADVPEEHERILYLLDDMWDQFNANLARESQQDDPDCLLVCYREQVVAFPKESTTMADIQALPEDLRNEVVSAMRSW
jgi:hypothetical protein